MLQSIISYSLPGFYLLTTLPFLLSLKTWADEPRDELSKQRISVAL